MDMAPVDFYPQEALILSKGTPIILTVVISDLSTLSGSNLIPRRTSVYPVIFTWESPPLPPSGVSSVHRTLCEFMHRLKSYNHLSINELYLFSLFFCFCFSP